MSILKRAFYLLSSVAINFTLAADTQQTTKLNLDDKIVNIDKTNNVSSATCKASSDKEKASSDKEKIELTLQLAPAWIHSNTYFCFVFDFLRKFWQKLFF